MANSGHTQLLNMAGEGKGKVDKTIKSPKGFGVVDSVFYHFQEKWKDEWRRRMGSQDGCNAIAGEWQVSLRPFCERDVLEAMRVCLGNTMPPTMASFISYVEQARENRKPVKRDRGFGRQQLDVIRQQMSAGKQEVKH